MNLLRIWSAFDTWTDVIVHWKAQKARAKHDAMIASLRINFQAVQDRASQRMQDARQKHWVKLCFEEWRGVVAYKAKLRNLATVGVERIAEVRLMDCFDGWLLFVQSHVNMKRLQDRSRRRAGQHRSAGIPIGTTRDNRPGR
jgi:hypothetical protein